ncbi:hypothetical protein [Paraburkholderia sp. BCC1884]|uniref:hypothetical protein n=1 Tax=Paraburkholderia sp. BCC1884 TaxID=2562668 RepID=UPI001643043F|nr:hypothetical protein [Paraburkholderia sp. BCC1884]
MTATSRRENGFRRVDVAMMVRPVPLGRKKMASVNVTSCAAPLLQARPGVKITCTWQITIKILTLGNMQDGAPAVVALAERRASLWLFISNAGRRIHY